MIKNVVLLALVSSALSWGTSHLRSEGHVYTSGHGAYGNINTSGTTGSGNNRLDLSGTATSHNYGSAGFNGAIQSYTSYPW